MSVDIRVLDVLSIIECRPKSDRKNERILIAQRNEFLVLFCRFAVKISYKNNF